MKGIKGNYTGSSALPQAGRRMIRLFRTGGILIDRVDLGDSGDSGREQSLSRALSEKEKGS